MIEQQQYRVIPTELELNGPILSFTTQPVGVTTTHSGIATFTGIGTATFPTQDPANPALNSGSISYRWYEVGVGALSDSTNITGTATTTLTLSNLKSPTDNGRQFYLGLDYIPSGDTPNANNEIFNSNTVSLNILPFISITSQPQQATIGSGGLATFSVEATLSDNTYGSLSYQWRIDGEDIQDGTFETQTTSNSIENSILALPLWDSSGSGIVDFSDISSNKKTVTISGNTKWETSVSKWYGGAAFFDGSSFFSITPTSSFAFGTGDFTIEAWCYFTKESWSDIFSTDTYSTYNSPNGLFAFRKNSNNKLSWYQASGYESTSKGITGGDVIPLNTWVHCAITRENGLVRMFLNGTFQDSDTPTNSLGNIPGVTAGSVRVGSVNGNAYPMGGYIQDLVVYNFAKYTTNFTPPTTSILSSQRSYTSISGSKSKTLLISPSNLGSNNIDVVVSNSSATSVTSNAVPFITTQARSIIKLEGYGTTSTATLLDKNIDESEFSITSDILNSDDICFYSSEKDLEVELDLFGAKGSNKGSFVGGEGGYSRIQFTMKKEEEYVLRGIKSNSALFLYRKGSLIAVVGQGGGAGNVGNGGKGGGVNLAGSAGSGAGAGAGGNRVSIGGLLENGTYGSASSLPLSSIYPQDQKATGTTGGQTIKCSKGVYWRNQGLSSCQDIGVSKFRLSDGTEVTNSASISRGFKAGYTINRTAGAYDSGAGVGGDGATGGNGGGASQGGGGGGSGYSDGSISIINTQLGGSTGNARVNVRLSAGDFFVDSAGRILILSNTDNRDPRTLTKVTGKVLPGTNTCIDDLRWQRFLDLARDGSQNYRLTATLDGKTTLITNATDRNIYRMLNSNMLTLRNSLTGWVDTGYSYTLLALAWDETDGPLFQGTGLDYSILSWSPTTAYGFGYYGSSSNSFFSSTQTYNNFSANYWILPPGVPDFS